MGMIQVKELNVTKNELKEEESVHLSAVGDRVSRPNPEVLEKPKRRTFSAAYKLKMLEAVDQCSEPEERGSLLRREGLYHSHILTWRQQRNAGQMTGLSPRKRGRKTVSTNPLSLKVKELERENERLRKELEKAETIIDVQKKISSLMGIFQEESDNKRRKP